MPWAAMELPEIDAKLPVKPLISDPDTGMSVVKIVYRAGCTNPTHWHTCSHGIYVLDGMFRSHMGDHGPGCFIWFPEGTVHQHGAAENDDATFLFITNKPFDIRYKHLVGDPPAGGGHAAQA